MYGPLVASVASMFPGSWFFGASERVSTAIKEVELDGAQFLPFLGLKDIAQVFPSGDPRVFSYEGRWGSGIWDAVLFGSPSQSDALEAEFLRLYPGVSVSHRWGDPLVEIHPEMGYVPTNLDELLCYPHKLTLDTYHLRRKAYKGGPSVLEQLHMSYLDVVKELFAEDKVGMLHFQPDRKATWGTAESELLCFTLRCLAQSPSVIPIVIETKPLILSGIFGMGATIRYLKEVRQFILDCAG